MSYEVLAAKARKIALKALIFAEFPKSDQYYFDLLKAVRDLAGDGETQDGEWANVIERLGADPVYLEFRKAS